MNLLPFYPLLLILISVISLSMAAVTFSKSDFLGSNIAGLITAGASIWAFATAMEALSHTLEGKVLWDTIQFTGVVLLSFWIVFVIENTQKKNFYPGPKKLLQLIPIAFLAIALTNGYHGLITSSYSLSLDEPLTPLIEIHGIGYWTFIRYVYVTAFIGSMLSLQMLILSHNVYKRKASSLIVIVVFPMVAGVFDVYHVFPIGIDWTPLVLNLTCWVVFLLDPFTQRPEDIVPIAHEMLMESMGDIVIILDEANRVVDYNQAASVLFTKMEVNVIGRDIEEIFNEEAASRKEWYSMGMASQDVKIGGRVYNFNVSSLIDYLNIVHGKVVVLRDITELKAMEYELKQHTENLEELVTEQTQRLRDQERMATIGETAAWVGHDLRNPLQVLTNVLFSMRKRFGSLVIKEEERAWLRQFADTLDDQVFYMEKIVGDLQEYTRRLNPKFVETDIRDIIVDVLPSVPLLEDIVVDLDIDEDFPKILVDPHMMKRVYLNLITNAAQAMPDGGQLRVRASISGEFALLSVEDTGNGIPEENIGMIFEPLFTTKSKGQGFGLAVCKRIVDCHYGEILVESRVGGGSTFTVKLPLRNEHLYDKAYTHAEVVQPVDDLHQPTSP